MSATKSVLRGMQEIVDEHKESLGDGAYVILCDGLKRLYELHHLELLAECIRNVDDRNRSLALEVAALRADTARDQARLERDQQ